MGGFLGVGEVVLVALVALVVVKPADVPELMRKFGIMTATLRNWVRGMWMGWQETNDRQGAGRDER